MPENGPVGPVDLDGPVGRQGPQGRHAPKARPGAGPDVASDAGPEVGSNAGSGKGGGEGRARRPAPGGTVLQSADAPVYAALADQWRSAGRMVPGQTDSEWAELVARIPRLTGV